MRKSEVGFYVSIAAVVLTTAIICVSAIACSGGTIVFEAEYYFVCYRVTDNSLSASSLSGTVTNYGGAGYILYYEDNYYITISCYYRDSDAQTVCASLKRRDLDCLVLTIETEEFKTSTSSAKQYAELYLGNLNTMHSLSVLAYDCANGLDTGEFNQTDAADLLDAIEDSLRGLLKMNANNCFTEDIGFLITQCENYQDGYVYSKDMRYLQIALIDVIVHADLY